MHFFAPSSSPSCFFFKRPVDELGSPHPLTERLLYRLISIRNWCLQKFCLRFLHFGHFNAKMCPTGRTSLGVSPLLAAGYVMPGVAHFGVRTLRCDYVWYLFVLSTDVIAMEVLHLWPLAQMLPGLCMFVDLFIFRWMFSVHWTCRRTISLVRDFAANCFCFDLM